MGVDSPANLLVRGAQLGLGGLGLCDVDSVAGLVEFVQAWERLEADLPGQGPRPILGAEISDPKGQPGRVVALVTSGEGWKSLCKLVSARRLGADPGGVAPEDLHGPASFLLVDAVLEFSAGLIFLVDHPRLLFALAGRLGEEQLFAGLPVPPPGLGRGASSAVSDATWSLFDAPSPPDPEHLYFIEAGKAPPPVRPDPMVVEALVGTAKALGIPMVAAPDCYFAQAEGQAAHRIRAAIRGNALVERVPDAWLAPDTSSLECAARMRELYDGYGPLLENTADSPVASTIDALFEQTNHIADRCRFTPELGGVIFPKLDLEAGRTAYSELAQLAFDGMSKRYRPLTPAVTRRMETELSAIDELGFSAYFLLVHRIAGFAKDSGIPCVGRGSAADSLVAYCLGLTDADPIRYKLPFERFLNPTRKDRPDIDLDFCWRRRDEVLEAVYETFGPTRTAMISTCGTFGLRSAFREAALAVGLAPAEFNRWSKRLPWSTPAPSTWREPPAGLSHMAHNPVAQAFANLPDCKHFPFDRFGGTLDAAALLLDVPRQMGLHPGGVVVAPHSITDHVACARAAKGPVVTQFDKDGVEAIGLVKMDLLGNRALTVLDDCLKILRDECGVEVDLEAIPEDDALTGELLAAGRTIGCFQIESPGMRNLLKQTAARTMDDVIQSIALIRPGPAGSGMKDAYVRRFRGLEEATPPHPLLEDVLSETYGVMLYQEDVMQVAVALAGMTLGESDRLRRALSKRGGSELEILQARFMEGSRQRGVATKDARHVWELVANFAAFGFCKAHAVTYGRISYRTAYLKAHFPVPFLAAFLASHTGYYAARVYVEEARRLGAAILGPDINRSGADYAFARLKGWPGLRAGLGQVRGLSEDTVAAILSSREADGPFLSLPDVIERTPAQRDEVEALIRTGALDAFDRTRPELLWRLHLLHGPARKAPRLTHGERPLDAMALESLGRSHGDRVAETVPSAGASPGLFDGNTGWGGSGGRLPFTAAQVPGSLPRQTAPTPSTGRPQQPSLAFPRRELGAAALPALPDPGAIERALAELELLGFSTNLHPVRLFGDPDLSAFTPCAELDSLAGTRITLLGWVAASRRLRGADGQWMRFLTLEDESGLAEAALFATANARWSHMLTDHGPFLVTGTVEEQMGACTLHVEHVERVD